MALANASNQLFRSLQKISLKFEMHMVVKVRSIVSERKLTKGRCCNMP